MRIETLVDQALDAAITADTAKVRADRLKAAAVAEAERLRVNGGLADRFPSSQGLGNLRLDGAGKPAAPQVVDPGAFASWLAQRQPDAVQATITVPAAQLAAALDAIKWSGIDATAAVAPGTLAGDFLAQRCHVQAATDGGWDVMHIAEDRTTELVPGVTAVRPAPRWVLTADRNQKRAAAERAADDVEAELAALDGDVPQPTPAIPAAREAKQPARPALTVVPDAAPPERVWDLAELDALKVDDLRDLCRQKDLRATGNKRDLIDRITAAATA